MKRITLNRKSIIKYLIVIAVALVIAWVPSGYYCMFPGDAESLGSMVSGGIFEPETSFHMTTVLMTRANYPVYLYGRLNPNVRVLPASSVIPQGWEGDQYQRYSRFQMAESHNSAKLAAARLLNINYVEDPGSITVLRTVEGSPAQDIMQSGDIIVSVGGMAVGSVAEATEALRSYTAGDSAVIGFERDGELMETEVELAEHPSVEGRGFLGVSLINEDHTVSFSGEYAIEIQTGNITGPSAGLMLTLEVMNRLTEEDLTDGREIGGTGTMSADGSVGKIGGIDQKLLTARKEGIEIFFLPQENFEEISIDASKYDGMELVVVATVDEALDYLREMIQE